MIPELKVPFLHEKQVERAANELLHKYAKDKGKPVRAPIDVENILEGYFKLDLVYIDLPDFIGVPDVLGKQGFYDIALAVHPAQKDHVVLGGSTFPAVTPSGATLLNSGNADDGAIVVADVAVNGAGTLTFGHPAAPKMVGAGVHADVHDLVYAKAGARLWAACDGGVYRSDRPDQLVGFAAMNDGLGVIEANYIACHPLCEGRVVVGLQDNGMISLRSAAAWNHDDDGDGDDGRQRRTADDVGRRDEHGCEWLERWNRSQSRNPEWDYLLSNHAQFRKLANTQ